MKDGREADQWLQKQKMEALGQFAEQAIIKIADRPARAYDPAAEAVAAEHGGHVQKIAPDATAKGHGGQKAHVPGQGA